MALEFFRRRQKMVIIIMVVLMVAFLVPSGMSMLLRRDPAKQERGQTRWGPLTLGDLQSAVNDVEILNAVGLGSYRHPGLMADATFGFLRNRNGDKAALAYALLLAEAKNAGVIRGDSDVKEFFDQIGLAEPQKYREFISQLRGSGREWTEPLVRQAIRHWLMINASAFEAQVDCPPSEAEVALTYRDMREQINLRVLKLKADEFLKDVPEPNQPAVEAQFQKYRSVLPGQLGQPSQFSFGYRQPGRAKIDYLLVRGDVIQRVTEPPFDQVVDYFNQNKADFVKKVPVGPPAVPPATQPTKDVPMTFAEAKQQVIDKLREDAVRGKMDELIGQAETEAHRVAKPGQAYADAAKAMTVPSDKVLATPLHGVKMEGVSLEDAVARLADAAKLKAICYPWGTQGKQTLLPSVKVTFSAEDTTLAAALDEISKQVKWPSLRWAMCSGFKGVLFSVKVGSDGIDFFPVQAADLPLKTFKEIAEDPILGSAYVDPAGRGMTLAESVFTAKELAAPGQKDASVMAKVGGEGGRMYVTGDKPGRMIWRLVAAVPTHIPNSLGDEPGLREQVVTDLRLQAAFRKAVQEANKIAKAAEAMDLEAIAALRKASTVATGLFSRLRFNPNTGQVNLMDVPALEITTGEMYQYEMYQYVMPQAFALAPKNVESGPAKEPPAIGVLPIPLMMEVLVMERIGYRPPLKPEYDELWRMMTAQIVMSQAQRQMMLAWFTLPVIEKRAGYTSPGGQD